MTSKAEWLALAERCEKATVPDDRLSFAIDQLLFAPRLIRGFKALAPYTASLDAITALIWKELTPVSVDLQTVSRAAYATIWGTGTRTDICRADTPALALCAAFCRAMAEKEPS